VAATAIPAKKPGEEPARKGLGIAQAQGHGPPSPAPDERRAVQGGGVGKVALVGPGGHAPHG
jgi:hypothetical protein